MIGETLHDPRLAATIFMASSRHSAFSDRRSALTLSRGERHSPTLPQIEYPLGAACPDSGATIASGMSGPSRGCAGPNRFGFTSRPSRDNRQLMRFAKNVEVAFPLEVKPGLSLGASAAHPFAEAGGLRAATGQWPVSSGKSCSRNSLPPRVPSLARACSVWRSSTRRILPEIVFGRSANSMRRTRLNGANRSRT